MHFLKERWLEATAVICNLLYTLLYINASPWCYLFGVIGPALLIVLSLRRGLYADPVLQLFYMAMAVYGWLLLKNGSFSDTWELRRSSWNEHLPWLLTGFLVSFAAGFLLKKFTSAKLPYLDSVGSVFGMIATWWMVNYVHENWLYFIAINALFIYICAKRKIFLAALMYFVYFLMAVDGYFELKLFAF